jgi:chemotaxis protein CheD
MCAEEAIERIDVYAGMIAIRREPAVLVASALGSCVGVAVWDPYERIGGLAHVMLPTAPPASAEEGLTRFADHAIPGLVSDLWAQGIPPRRLVAKIAGGAAMFHGDTALAHIGQRNVEEVKRVLKGAGIRLAAEDTGGSWARTVELHTGSGTFVIRSYSFGVKEI